jgi:hypothetical protein
VVIPFTLCSLLLCHHITVNVPGWLTATTLATRAPGKKIVATRYPQLFLSAFGSGAMKRPCKSRPLGASMRLAPAYRKRFGDFQPDHDIAISLLFQWHNIIAE